MDCDGRRANALLLVAFAFFGTILAVWLVAALRQAERGWALAAVAVIAASVALGVAVYTQSRFVLRVIDELTGKSFFLTDLLVFVPMLATLVPATIYSIRRAGRIHAGIRGDV